MSEKEEKGKECDATGSVGRVGYIQFVGGIKRIFRR